MGKLKPISQRDLIARLRSLGFEGPFSGGKHPIMVRGVLRLTIPNVHGVDIGIDLLARLLRQANVSRERWEELDG